MLGEPKLTTPTREIKLTRLSPDACIDVVGAWLSRTDYPLRARDAYASNRRWNLEDEIHGAVIQGPDTSLRIFKTEEESVVAFLTQPWKSRGEVPLALQLDGFSNEIPPFKEALVEGFIAETKEADQTAIIGVEYHPLEIKRNSNPDTIVGDIVERVYIDEAKPDGGVEQRTRLSKDLIKIANRNGAFTGVFDNANRITFEENKWVYNIATATAGIGLGASIAIGNPLLGVASTAVGILSAHQAFYRLLETNEMGPFSGSLSNIFEDLWFDAEHSRRVSVVENVSEVLKKINAGIMVVGDTPHILRYCDLIGNTERARATKIKSWIYHHIPGLMVKGRLYAPNGEIDVWPDLIK